ncbi:hypothetical protein INS49_014685 [Diaporthe citri]|uniref:uncharacterized protein n=1 Tax=Diaporthe citri TaxID=83186 RepID=UPI001C7E8B4C|nr:uncharacterized protein INS49_014685 [Diaporthe citri]KAG6356811.1 hypothetical protein INS49_014685 [Diaporthe citri]
MAITIYEAFNQALPSFVQLGTQVDTRAKSSGTTTEACKPPRCGIKIPVEHWTTLGSRLCLDQHKDDLRSRYLSPVDNSMAFKSEADVVEASAAYLRQPVQIAYQLVHPKDICLKQLTKPRKDVTAASRVDIAYFSEKPNDETTPGNSSNVFAVLEYKKFDGLSREQFKKGTVSNSKDYATALRHSPFIGSKSQSSTEIVLKQATHYASKFVTPFVALCDYNTLILLVMNQVEGYDGGHYTYVTVVEKSVYMRKAYLGFLLAARLHAQGNDDWRKSGAGEDLFVDAEDWERAFESENLKPNPVRETKNPDPVHDLSSSQERAFIKSMFQDD